MKSLFYVLILKYACGLIKLSNARGNNPLAKGLMAERPPEGKI